MSIPVVVSPKFENVQPRKSKFIIFFPSWQQQYYVINLSYDKLVNESRTKTLYLLASRGPTCSNRDSHKLQIMGKWLMTTNCTLLHTIGHIVSDQLNTGMSALAPPLPLSSLTEGWTRMSMLTCRSLLSHTATAVHLFIKPDYPHSVVHSVWKGQAFLQSTFLS